MTTGRFAKELGLVSIGGSRKLFWDGHIGLESPKATKRDTEGVEGNKYGEGVQWHTEEGVRG